ncbi:MAG: hypothetical protein IS632_01535 [Thaumarchaeota archaeon]|nr:hypothetical protein [Nitrososphaerota archaeon]
MTNFFFHSGLEEWFLDIRGKSTVVALALFLIPLLVASGVATADGQAAYRSLDIHVTVTDVVREHGNHTDLLTFTVTLQNTGGKVISIEGIYLWDQSKRGSFTGSCVGGTVYLMPTETRQIEPCFAVFPATTPKAILFVDESQEGTTHGARHIIQRHALPFASGVCGDGYVRDHSCQTMQSIATLIRNIEPEPMVCDAPAPATEPVKDVPNINSAVYHRHLNYTILTFDTPVILADNWQGNMSVLAETGFGAVELDGLDAGARSVMPDGSTLVWLSLAYDDAKQLVGVTNMTLRLGSGTIMYGDGLSLESMVVSQVMVVP